jgi:hypothetical protein
MLHDVLPMVGTQQHLWIHSPSSTHTHTPIPPPRILQFVLSPQLFE